VTDGDGEGGAATGGFDLQAMLAQAQQMQQRMLDAREAVAGELVEGSAGGGLVRVTATGAGEFTSVRIAPQVVDPGDVGMLEDLVLAALHDTANRIAELSQKSLGELGLGDLGGLLGGG
jgi:DNA-binding YbaB/EbfC family protein